MSKMLHAHRQTSGFCHYEDANAMQCPTTIEICQDVVFVRTIKSKTDFLYNPVATC
jgi:hypothetical protein